MPVRLKPMQQRLEPLKPKKFKGEQVSYVDQDGLQWIELNRGSKEVVLFVMQIGILKNILFLK